MSSQIPNLSVVVLCYRGEEAIIPFVKSLSSSLSRIEPNWEIVLVGNYFEGSGDKTPEVVRELAKNDPRLRAVARVKEGMMGWDLKSGLQATTGKVLAFIDGDGQMPCEDVGRCYNKLKEGGFDLVKTFREVRKDGFYRSVISIGYNLFFNMLFPGLKSSDINSKPKVMTRELYRQLDLKSDDWFIDAEIMIQVRRLKLKTYEIPTVFHDIKTRSSFIKPRAIIEFLANLIMYRILEFKRWFAK